MAKETTSQPVSQPKVAPNQDQSGEVSKQPETATELTFNAHPKTVTELRKAKADLLQFKVTLLSSVNADLSEAARLTGEGSAKATAASVYEESALLSLYRLRTARIYDEQGNALVAMSGNELTSTLGDKYGYKINPDTGKQSKTPVKQAEAIRKRVVRLVNAFEAVEAFEAGKPEHVPDYFKSCQSADLQAVLSRVEAKGLSPYSAYDKLGEIVADSRTPKLWFETIARVETLTKDLAKASPELLDAVKGNNMLKSALADLVDSIRISIDY